jgi:hypothetical protein
MEAIRTSTFLAATLALTLAAGAQAAATAPETVITDPLGDANGLSNAPGPVSVALTSPASDAPRDITSVTFAREDNALVLRLALAAAPDATPVLSFYTVAATVAGCAMKFVISANEQDANFAAAPPRVVTDTTACGTASAPLGAGYTVAVEGTTLVARMPLAALGANRLTLVPGTTLRQLSAESRRGTYVTAGGSAGVPQLHNYVGPLLDLTGAGTDYTVPDEEPVAG